MQPPPEKGHHSLYEKLPSKDRDPVKPPHLFENLVGGSTPHPGRKGGVHCGLIYFFLPNCREESNCKFWGENPQDH